MTEGRRKEFALSSKELHALEAAYAEFLEWDRSPVDPAMLAAIRKAARGLHKALLPFHDGPTNLATRDRLTLRMQEVERFQRPRAAYADDLTQMWWLTQVIDSACAYEVKAGQKRNQRADDWIIRAATAWQRAGGTASSRGRFRNALMAFRREGLPHVGSEDSMKEILLRWRAWQRSMGGELQTANDPLPN